MKEYRNKIRSRQMIKQALIDLLQHEDISKITVKKVVEKADLSRNTFYAHYDDIYAIIEEIQEEVITKCTEYLDEVIKEMDESKILSFFINIMGIISDDEATYRVLLTNDLAGQFIEKLKGILISRTISSIPARTIKDKRGFSVFLDVLFAGVIDLLKLYLTSRLTINTNEIAVELNKIFLAGYKLYI